MSLGPLAAAAAASSVFSLGATAFFTTVAFGIGLPTAIAVFPQVGSIDLAVLRLEDDRFKDVEGDVLYYNKGL